MSNGNQGNFIKPSSLMAARAAAKRIGWFDERLCSGEGREFLIRLVFEGNFVYTATPSTRYRWHDDNLSQIKNAKTNLRNGLRVWEKVAANSALPLHAAQRAACDRFSSDAIQQYLYVSAICGARDYFRGWRSSIGCSV